MIQLVRGIEPDQLADKRPHKIAQARAAFSSGRKALGFTFTGYGDDGVKEKLFQGQHRKCAYCEKREEQAKYREAEHYRPKSSYWWLAWTWENLLFACIECNRDHKRSMFPLVDESRRLAAEQPPPGDERPLLIDPYDPTIDPRDELEFRRERVQGKERWTPRGRTARGEETVRICGLDRPALLGLYEKHVRNFVRPAIERFLAAARSEDARIVVAAWSTLRRRLFAPGQEFCALSRDVVRVLVPADLRARYHLEL